MVEAPMAGLSNKCEISTVRHAPLCFVLEELGQGACDNVASTIVSARSSAGVHHRAKGKAPRKSPLGFLVAV